MALFTSLFYSLLLSQVTEGAYSSFYAAGNAFQRVEKEFFAEPFGARGRGKKTWPFYLLSTTLALRERGQSAASSTLR